MAREPATLARQPIEFSARHFFELFARQNHDDSSGRLINVFWLVLSAKLHVIRRRDEPISFCEFKMASRGKVC